jgi:4-hydroxyphenylacetate 3-monooxygenase
MLRSGDAYLSALNDGRRIYLGGELVADVTTHPAFRDTAHSFAMLYDKKKSVDQIDAMSFESAGDRCSIWFLAPRTKSDLRARMEGHRRIARWSYGLFGRSPDHVASFIAGLTMQSGLFEQNRAGFAEHLTAFFDRLTRHDLFASYCVIGPQGARNPTSFKRAAHQGPALQVIQETSHGIVISGVKMLGTAAIYSDVAWVGNLLPLASDQSRQAVTCAVPINAEGLSIWVRAPASHPSIPSLERPFSAHFDESDGVMVFDKVEVPWSDVFLLDDVSLSREIYFDTPSHVMGNHQATIRFLEKLRVLLGIAYKAAELNDVLQVQPVRDTLSKMAAAEATLQGMISGSIEDSEAIEGAYVHVNRRSVYAALLWCTNNYHLLAESVREMLGAGPFQMPADSSFMSQSAMRESFERYWVGATGSATERFRFMKTAWDYLGSELTTRHGQYERFYAGPQFIHSHYNYAHCPWEDYKQRVERVMETIMLPEVNQLSFSQN